MSRAELLALVARVEAATGPDRELDYAILRVLKPEYAGSDWQPYAGGLRHVNDSSDARTLPAHETCPQQWTSSLDAAASLVPEGWRWSLDYTQRPAYQDCGCASLFAPGSRMHPPDVSEIYAATPALALCAAALRARAEEARDE